MLSFVILILGVLFIFKDEIKSYINAKRIKNEVSNEELDNLKERANRLSEDLDKMMNYSLQDAINSKKR